MNNFTAAPAVTGDSKTLINVTPVVRDDEITATPAKGNDEVMSQPAKQS